MKPAVATLCSTSSEAERTQLLKGLTVFYPARPITWPLNKFWAQMHELGLSYRIQSPFVKRRRGTISLGGAPNVINIYVLQCDFMQKNRKKQSKNQNH